jgi:hypothetical protein
VQALLGAGAFAVNVPLTAAQRAARRAVA